MASSAGDDPKRVLVSGRMMAFVGMSDGRPPMVQMLRGDEDRLILGQAVQVDTVIVVPIPLSIEDDQTGQFEFPLLNLIQHLSRVFGS